MTFSHTPFTIRRAAVVHRQVPIDRPVKTAFGTMTARHAVFLRLEIEEGQTGVGESWVNFPIWAPWERVAALERAFIPYLHQHSQVDNIPTYVTRLYRAFLGPARQSGTIGPLLQGMCAVENALWDAAARATGLRLCQLFAAQPHPSVQVYASGINSPLPFDLIDEHLAQGVALFKLKLGFDDDLDRKNLQTLHRHLGHHARLAVDVNRGWTFEQARRWLPLLAEYDVYWLEEPLTAEEEPQLEALRGLSPVPIAGGENVMTPPGTTMNELLDRPFDLWQPDVTKYTPLHVALELNRATAAAGSPRLVPHFLGSGPGQALSLQLAAACPEGLVELDLNRNPLRTELMDQPFEIIDGRIAIPDRPGLGWTLA